MVREYGFRTEHKHKAHTENNHRQAGGVTCLTVILISDSGSAAFFTILSWLYYTLFPPEVQGEYGAFGEKSPAFPAYLDLSPQAWYIDTQNHTWGIRQIVM